MSSKHFLKFPQKNAHKNFHEKSAQKLMQKRYKKFPQQKIIHNPTKKTKCNRAHKKKEPPHLLKSIMRVILSRKRDPIKREKDDYSMAIVSSSRSIDLCGKMFA
jgi:hypothetical protein